MEIKGQTTKLTLAKPRSKSLRTTVPMSIVRQFDLKSGDKLAWTVKIQQGQLAILVLPTKKSASTLRDKKLYFSQEQKREKPSILDSF